MQCDSIKHAQIGGVLVKSSAPEGPFEMGPNPFNGTEYSERVRHVAVLQRGEELYVFFSGIGDPPERNFIFQDFAQG
jgi:hypothetical protein